MSGKEYHIQATWVSGMQFVARGLESQSAIVMDAPEESGGAGQGMRPTEALLSAVAACSGMDVISILRKMRQNISGVTVNVTGVRAEEYPRAIVHATVEYVVTGTQVSDQAVARAVSLSETKYCGVMASLKAEVLTRYRIEAA
jgi:putative redox protein